MLSIVSDLPHEDTRHRNIVSISYRDSVRSEWPLMGDTVNGLALFWDLSSNQIKSIEPGAFSGLISLIKLDLSGNGLKMVNASLFEGMPKLQKLELAGNELSTIPEGTFDVLPSLVKVDFQSRKLVCDCLLQWIVKWQKMKNVRIRDSTVCEEPPEHRGRSVKDLKKKQFTCDEEVELAYFELSPATSQVVFEGDQLQFECRASVRDMDAHMMWVRGGQKIANNQTLGILIHQTYSPDNSILMQSLILRRLQVSHSGVWTCFIQTARGNTSKSVNVIVMSLQATYCPAVNNITAKGTYSWPKTVSGLKTSLPCERGPAAWYKGESAAMATHMCTVEGHWEQLDVNQCAYVSEVTQILEQYSTIEFANSSEVLAYMEKLLGEITDKMDIVYISRIMESINKQVKVNDKVADFLLETASKLSVLDSSLLRAAQAQDGSCSKIIKVLDSLPKELLWDSQLVHKSSPYILMAAYQVTADDFEGMTCNVYKPKGSKDKSYSDIYHDDSLVCVEGPNSTTTDRDGFELEASIHIPGDIFHSVRCLYPLCSKSDSFHLQFIVYKNSKLFPVVGRSGNRASQQRVVTSVISANIAGVSVDNTSSPIVTKLRLPEKVANHRAVYWDFLANNGKGSWLSRGCSIVKQKAGIATVHCNHLTHFGISQDISVTKTPIYNNRYVWFTALFTMSPIMYAGSVMLTACTMAVIITYISGHKFIQMPSKNKHAVANMCLCLLLLCVTFTLGICLHEPVTACQIVGVTVHYLSLAELFWIIILTFTIYKKLSKAIHPPPAPVDSLEEAPPPRSVVTCYLIGWGIPVIICGISGAIKWKDYGKSGTYCFLPLDSAVVTFFGPVGIVLFVLFFMFLRLGCLLRNSSIWNQAPSGNENDTEEIQVMDGHTDSATEDLITTVAAAGTVISEDLPVITSGSLTKKDLTASQIDLQCHPTSQLKGLMFLVFLYLLTWTAGALAITLPFLGLIPYQDLIFSYLYGFISTGLGVYILVFYCIRRQDCREAWRRCCVYPAEKIEIEEIPPPMSMHQVNQIQISNHIQSASSVSSVHSNTISSFNPGLYGLQKPSKINLLPSQTSGTDHSFTGSQDPQNILFYNPRQNGIARKYWERKNHRKMLSQMSKEMNADSGHSSTTEGRGGMIYAGGKRLSYHGNSSDGNLPQSINLPIQPRNGIILDPRVGGQLLSKPEMLENVYNSLSRREMHDPQASLTIDPVTGAPMLCAPINRQLNAPATGYVMPYHPINYLALDSSSSQLAGSSHLIPPTEGLNYLHVQPLINETPLHFSPNQYLLDITGLHGGGLQPGLSTSIPQTICQHQKNTLPRSRDFDGQSLTSNGPISHTEPPSLDCGKSATTKVTNNPTDILDLSNNPHNDSNSCNKSKVPGHVTESDGDMFSDTDPFLKEIKQRIPQSHVGRPPEQHLRNIKNTSSIVSDVSSKSPTPPACDLNGCTSSDGGVNMRVSPRVSSQSSHDGKGSGADSQQSKPSRTHSEPIHDSGSYQKSNHSQSLPRSGNKSWEEEFANKPRNKSSYAFVNHDYRERVLHKLIKQSQQSGSSLVDSGVSWLPRSVSAYEQVLTTETDTLVEESSSSGSDDSDADDDIWVLQQARRRKKLNQETSV
ncbi:hypothetical protein LSH36_773g00046 [Paralvinella palmiformis]|uniref:Adhesion G protein-coupled receptor A3 n=1 Tax=Paralvinella palmiformis TaxID=53620 RepID=A0AAD9J0U9_9ANNE|nr:hypothetical protein LSH36_773g00046 [Paralvinella palmiformis]